MMHRSAQSEKGSVLLVALCFVTVLGISLASYIAVCSRTMQVSNRTAQASLSRQLAEMGLEEALRAFNKNDWSDWSNGPAADWTVSGTTATCNLTFPPGTFGQGLTGSVKIRVDNYNAAKLGSDWKPSANYRTNDLVGSGGMWYRCLINNSNKSPATNNTCWIQEQSPINWTWITGKSYNVEDFVYYNSGWYRCISPHTSSSSILPPTSSSYWTNVPNLSASYNSGAYYYKDDIMYYSPLSTWLYCLTPGTGGGSWGYAPISWRWRSSKSYNLADVVYYAGVWYRCTTAHTSGGSFDSTNWTDSQSSTAMTATNALSTWNSNVDYSLNDVVYYSGSWYRCVVAHAASQTPSSSSTYWANTPSLPRNWDSGKQYSQYDAVYYNGVRYLSLQNSNYGQNPSTQTTYWTSPTNSSYQWNLTTAYSAGAYRNYGGVWYKCLVGNTGQSPNNTTYWTSAWAQSSGITTGSPVVYAEGTVNLPGSAAIKTQIRAVLSPAPLFPNAAGATTTLNILGGSGSVDSYDSTTDPTAASPGYSAVLASTYTTSPAITISNTTDLKGYVAAPTTSASPSTPLFTYGSSVTVRSATSPASPKVDPTRVSRSPYVPQFDAVPTPLSTAFSSWTYPPGNDLSAVLAATTDIGIPGAISPVRYYYNGTLNIGSGYTCSILNINGPVILYINGNIRIRSGGAFNVKSAGSAVVHADGGIRSDTGGDGYYNQTRDPKKLILISDVSNTATQWQAATNYPLYAVLYMPNTTTSLGLEIRTGVQLYGAISARAITFSTEANIHYDTSLRYVTIPGVDQPYAITEWRELTDASELATMP